MSFRCYGIQFPPEVTRTLQGTRIFEQFVLVVCGCDGLWTAAKLGVEGLRASAGGVHGAKIDSLQIAQVIDAIKEISCGVH